MLRTHARWGISQLGPEVPGALDRIACLTEILKGFALLSAGIFAHEVIGADLEH